VIRRAKDNLIPELKDMDKPKKAEPSPIRKGVTPHQNKLSVQDVRDYSTPAGASMANEEMRRLRLYVNEVANKVDTKTGGDTPSAITPTKINNTPGMDSKPDSFGGVDSGLLSVKHNNILVGEPRHVESLNYLDYNIGDYEKEYIGFELDASRLEQNLTSDFTFDNKRQINIKAFVNRKIKKGLITINKLPDNSVGYEEIDAWKRAGLFFTPEYGKYGWYVYNYIDHGWLLDDPNDYMLTLVDTHQFDDEGILIPDAQYKQQFIPEHEGMRIQYRDADNVLREKDIIIIRGIFKPFSDVFMGTGIQYDQVETNEPERLINTNLVFHYTLEVRQ